MEKHQLSIINYHYILKVVLALCSGILLLTACDEVAEQDRLQYAGPVIPEREEGDSARFAKAVLIEDFTGQRCSNCPDAAILIEQMLEMLGEEAIVPVGIHCGALGIPETVPNVGLMNDEGKAYGEKWAIPYQPIGMVNRVGGLKDFRDWSAIVMSEIQKDAPMKFAPEIVYSADTRTAKMTISMTAATGQDVSGKLQLWLTEDNIVTLQTMQNGSFNTEYVHNHVFRKTLNGMDGEDVSIAAGETAEKVYEISIPETYKAENCSVVMFIYNNEEVLQVAKAALAVIPF